MRAWPYAQRLRAVRGNRQREDFARLLTSELGWRINGQMIANWEGGQNPRCAHLLEPWIRKKEPPKPPPAPRPFIGLSFNIFLDTGTVEEARNIEALLLGIVKALRARWPEPSEPEITHGLAGASISHPATPDAIARCMYCQKTGDDLPA